MFGWARTRLRAWAQSFQEREIERLLKERRRLIALLPASNGGKPIRFTEEQQRRLDALRKKMDPETLRQIDLLTDAE